MRPAFGLPKRSRTGRITATRHELIRFITQLKRSSGLSMSTSNSGGVKQILPRNASIAHLAVLAILASVMLVGLFAAPAFATTSTFASKTDIAPTPLTTCTANGSSNCYAPGTTVTFEYDLTRCSTTACGTGTYTTLDYWLFALVTVLPPGETYVSTVSTTPAATTTSAPTSCPSGGSLTVDTQPLICPSGYTYVQWNYSPAVFITSTSTPQVQVVYQASVGLPGAGTLEDTTTTIYNTQTTSSPTPTAANGNTPESDWVFVQGSPSITTALSSSSVTVGTAVTDTATLAGGFTPMTGSITYNVYTNSACTTAVPAGTGAGDYNPDVVTVSGSDGVQTTSTPFTGLASTGNYWWQAVYTPDANNIGAMSACTSEPLTVSKATTSLSTSLASSSITVGASTTDTATLSGGSSPTGTVTFNVYSGTTCTTLTTSFTGSTLSGSPLTSTATISGLSVGSYEVQAVYAGDSNNAGSTSSCGSEPLTVIKATTSLTTSLTSSSITPGASTTDTATLSGGSSPTGTVTFNVYSGTTCTTLATSFSGTTLSGSPLKSTATISGLGVGSYEVQAVYAGDSNNAGSTSSCGSEPLTVSPVTVPEFPMGILVLVIPAFAIYLYVRGRERSLGARIQLTEAWIRSALQPAGGR